MSGNGTQISLEMRHRIGHAVRTLRQSGLSWKELEDRFQRSRFQLLRYVQAVLTDDRREMTDDETPSPTQ